MKDDTTMPSDTVAASVDQNAREAIRHLAEALYDSDHLTYLEYVGIDGVLNGPLTGSTPPPAKEPKSNHTPAQPGEECAGCSVCKPAPTPKAEPAPPQSEDWIVATDDAAQKLRMTGPVPSEAARIPAPFAPLPHGWVPTGMKPLPNPGPHSNDWVMEREHVWLAEVNRLRRELHEQEQRVTELEGAINWALGGPGSDFRERREGEGAYWWRTELQRRANLQQKGQ